MNTKLQHSKFLLTSFLSLILIVGTIEVNAQQASSEISVLEGMKWRNIGPHRGGRSLGISGSPQRKDEYYFGAVGGGLWKTVDGGLNWKPVTDGQLNSSSVGAVAVSPTDPDIVYIGTGETQLRGNIMQGDGVYKSTDAGKTWENIGLKETQAIARVRVHPENPDIVYVAALGHPYGPNEERGIFKTVDGGKSWKKVLYKSDQAGGVDLIIDPSNPEVVYASLWEVYRTPWKMWGGGGDSGLFKSTDGGESWEELTRKPGMPEGTVGKIGVTVSPVDPNRVWAIVESDNGGVYRSDDAGMNWELVNEERKLRQRAFYYSRIYADPQNKDGVYCLNVGFYKSTDGGVKFDKVIDVPHGDNHDLWIDPNDSTRLAASNDGGGTISTNSGVSWSDEDFPTSQLYHIMVTNDFPYHVAGAQQDNSTMAIPNEGWDNMLARQNTNKPQDWFYPVGGGESGYIAQDPKNPDIFYAGSQGALLTRYNRKTGQIRDVQVYPRFFSGEPSSALPERWQWTFPIVFSPLDPNRLYTCSQHVWYTTDEGQSWEKISPDLTLADTATLGISGGVITRDMNGPEIYATVFALAPSFHDVNTIWAGSDDGLVHITRDHGKSWENITPPDMPEHTRISIIDASRHHAGTAYIAAKRYQMDDRAPYIWKTDDYGRTWEKIVSGIRSDDYVHAVREDITKAGLLYAGTEHGVWVSFNNGEAWHPLQLDLPDTQVADLIVTENDLVIGTHGRSIYVLDDIAPIREYDSELTNADFHFFKPYAAVRDVQNAGFQYYLAEQADTITIEIMDANGKVIRTFVGDKPEYEEKKEPGRRRGGDDKLPTTAQGLNRFEWDLRYPGATEFEGMIIWSGRPTRGPMAAPGTYQVKITADGESVTHPIEVKLDPRLEDVSEEDIHKQFELAMAIRDKTSQANEAVVEIRKIKEMLKENGGSRAEKVIAELSEVEEALYQVKNQSSQDPLNFPIKLNNRLASLRRSVETGNARPTEAAYVVFDELSAELDVQMTKLNKIMDNKMIDRLGM